VTVACDDQTTDEIFDFIHRSQEHDGAACDCDPPF
jgi:hypothetical protein